LVVVDHDGGRDFREAAGGPFGEHVESEASQAEFLVEVGDRLLGGGQDVAGGDAHRATVAPRGGRPLFGGQSLPGVGHGGPFGMDEGPDVGGPYG